MHSRRQGDRDDGGRRKGSRVTDKSCRFGGSAAFSLSKNLAALKNCTKVFARLFQKAALSRARSPCRRAHAAKSPYRRFFLLTFSLRLVCQRKSGHRLCAISRLARFMDFFYTLKSCRFGGSAAFLLILLIWTKMALHFVKFCGIIAAESLASQVFWLCHLRTMCACGIDGFAKMSVQAHIFASWYNECV